MNWYSTKIHLNSALTEKTDYIISRDIGNEGAKQYAFVKSSKQLVEMVKHTTPRHFYEVVENIVDVPTYVFFDIDRSLDTKTTTTEQDVLSSFLHAFSSFMKHQYKFTQPFVEGQNYHVATASTPLKISLHIKFNMTSPNLKTLKAFVNNFITYIATSPDINVHHRSNLMLEKIVRSNLVSVCAIDTNVYGNFQNFRMLYSAKSGKTNILKPYEKSSSQLEDHLVIVYKDNAQSSIYTITDKSYMPSVKTYTPKTSATKFMTKTIPTPYVPNHIDNWTKKLGGYIQQCDDLKNSIGDFNLLPPVSVGNNTYLFHIDPKSKTKCLYADRCHKSNRQFFEYTYHKYDGNIVLYKCHDDECKAMWKNEVINFRIRPEAEFFKKTCDHLNTKTFHCKDSIINWNEDYTEDKMRPYPDVPLCCIRAGMGLGKTEEAIKSIKNILSKSCETNTIVKILFITFSRTLSRKYQKELEEMNFTNYLDIENRAITKTKVIVCLDSLYRVKVNKFDYIFIDEAVSVLTHFNSDVMKKTQQNFTLFEKIMLEAKHIYMMDAMADNTIVYNVMEQISFLKNTPVYWIKNRYIRPSNRTCQIIKNDFKNIDVATHISNRLSLGKKVVCPCSSKQTLFEILTNLALIDKNEYRILQYDRDTDPLVMADHAKNINTIWDKYDLLIYSPSISAGMSFFPKDEDDKPLPPYYDELIACFENRLGMPPLDTDLQMLYRVRLLNDGNMTIYIKNDDDKVCMPDTEATAERFLERDITRLNNYIKNTNRVFPVWQTSQLLHFEPNGNVNIAFDIERLSYDIIKGIVINTGKSYNHFTDILIDTLKHDYNIPVKILTDIPKYIRTTPIKRKQDITDLEDEFVDECVLGQNEHIAEEEFMKLEMKKNKEEPLKYMELVSYNVYKFFVNTLKLSFDYTDYYDLAQYFKEVFYPDHVDKAYKKFHKLVALKRIMKYTILHNQEAFKEKINAELGNYRKNQDGNIVLYKTHWKKTYPQVIETQSMLNHVGIDIQDIKNENITLEEGIMKDGVKAYLEAMSSEQFYAMKKVVGLETRYFKTKDEAMAKACDMFKAILHNTTPLKVTFKVGTRHKEHKMYGRDGKINIALDKRDILIQHNLI